MPELAEVEITRRKLLPLVRGRRILDFWTDWARGLRSADSVKRTPHKSLRDYTGQVADSMRGRKILDVTRRGKVIFFKLSGRPERVLAIHLGMSGRLEATHHSAAKRHPNPEPFDPASSGTQGKLREGEGSPGILRPDVLSGLRMTGNLLSHWIHFRWLLSGGRELRLVDPRKFGRVWYGAPEELGGDPYLGRLGRDARDIKFSEFTEIIRSGRGMIKPFLLKQDNFAGIGNIIADESLWLAKIHPRMNTAELKNPQIIALYRAIQKTISAMLSSGGTSLRNWEAPGGRPGRYQERRLVYGKAGQACPRCRAKLKRIVIGGRGTTICPRCQSDYD